LLFPGRIGHEMTLEISDIVDLIDVHLTECHYLGIPLNFISGSDW
jgi:hypothetical protein